MARATYQYTPYSIQSSSNYLKESTAYRPVASAVITASNGESFRTTVLLDSGADACLFPLSIANLLKLDVFRLQKALTVGVGSQTNVTYYDTVQIDLGNDISFTTKVGFTQGLDSVGFGLLGQSGFFDRYNVEFRHAEKIFTIENSRV